MGVIASYKGLIMTYKLKQKTFSDLAPTLGSIKTGLQYFLSHHHLNYDIKSFAWNSDSELLQVHFRHVGVVIESDPLHRYHTVKVEYRKGLGPRTHDVESVPFLYCDLDYFSDALLLQGALQAFFNDEEYTCPLILSVFIGDCCMKKHAVQCIPHAQRIFKKFILKAWSNPHSRFHYEVTTNTNIVVHRLGTTRFTKDELAKIGVA